MMKNKEFEDKITALELYISKTKKIGYYTISMYKGAKSFITVNKNLQYDFSVESDEFNMQVPIQLKKEILDIVIEYAYTEPSIRNDEKLFRLKLDLPQLKPKEDQEEYYIRYLAYFRKSDKFDLFPDKSDKFDLFPDKSDKFDLFPDKSDNSRIQTLFSESDVERMKIDEFGFVRDYIDME